MVCLSAKWVTEARLQGRKVKAPGSAQHTGGSYAAFIGSEPPIPSEDTNTPSHLCDLQSDDYMVPRKGKKVEVWVPSITWSHQTLRTPPAALGQSGERDEEGEERRV